MDDRLKMRSKDLTQDNLEKIRALFPNCITEVRDEGGGLRLAVDFDLLRQELASEITEGPQERYRLDWPGKREAMLLANSPIAKTLRPIPDESTNFDKTRNLFIEGDNLEALKLLQENYLAKVQMIYIDPPYNTRKDFIYSDDFAQSTDEYLELSLQKSYEGDRLIANTESRGRLHSAWLSMMLPRLRLARNLLSDDGVIFISIDDNELYNLKNICDEIFGMNNFLGTLSWAKKRKGSFLSKKIVSLHEYILVYGRTDQVQLFGGKPDANESQPLIKRTNNISTLRFLKNTVHTKMEDAILRAGTYGSGTSSVLLHNDINIEDGLISSDFSLTAPFVWSQTFLDEQISLGAKVIINTINLQVRVFKPEDEHSFKGLSSLIDGVELQATNEDGYEQLKELFEIDSALDYPKPINLIKTLVKAQTYWDKDAYVLDFFAGSSTTAHAVMSLNAEDGGNRRFIMVQLPEAVSEKHDAYNAGYETIAEISKERIRRAGKLILGGVHHEGWKKDIGFRVLKVDSSNMKGAYYRPDEVTQGSLMDQISLIKEDRSGADLLFHVMLDLGLKLDLPIKSAILHGKEVFFVDEDLLVACFEPDISENLILDLTTYKPLRMVFADICFGSNDSLKTNAQQIFKQQSPSTSVVSF